MSWGKLWWAGCLGIAVALGAGCGDSVHGTTTTSPPLPPLDGDDASAGSGPTSGPPATSTPGDDGGPAPVVPPSTFTCQGKTGATGDLTLTLTSGGYARDSL